MKYLILGRSGSGKDALRLLLEKRGLTFVKSATTREPRFEGEDTHIFVDRKTAEEEFKTAVATTEINGELYYGTRESLLAADAYITDPNGMFELLEKVPDVAFRIIYMTADPDQKTMMALNRVQNDPEQAEIYKQRCESEHAMFSDFEDIIARDNALEMLPANVSVIYQQVNDYQIASLEEFADRLAADMHLHNNTQEMLSEAMQSELVTSFEPTDDTNNFVTHIDTGETLPTDILVENIIINKDNFSEFMSKFFSNKLKDVPSIDGKAAKSTQL